MTVSVILPTHNPPAQRLVEVLEAVCAQTLPRSDWECCIVDNASAAFPESALAPVRNHAQIRIVREPRLGLTFARRTGIEHTTGEFLVWVDDDNLLAPDYLETAVRSFANHPRLGAAGGRIHPRFDSPVDPWKQEFFPLLALRDFGDASRVAAGVAPGQRVSSYPEFAPVGAGLALRRNVAEAWIRVLDTRQAGLDGAGVTDRTGDRLDSGGDNDLILTALNDGWSVGYFPELRLQHIIPPGRLEQRYLGRLNRGIQRSWIKVLALHGIRPWPAIPRWTLPVRKLRAYLRQRAWSSPASRIRWEGACGHFEGRVNLTNPISARRAGKETGTGLP